MPYLTPEDKARLDPMLEQAEAELRRQPNPGALNYMMTRLALAYLCDIDNAKYATRAEIVGAFESAKLEFYRRAVAGYEDRKAAQNGDVYHE